MFNDLDDLHKWLAFEVMDAYCLKRDELEHDGDGCAHCPLHGCEDCPTEVIKLAKELEWRHE